MTNEYSREDRIFLVKNYYRCQGNVTETLRKWSTQFKNRPKPSYSTLKNLIEKFERTGMVVDDIANRKNKPKTSRTPEILKEVKAIMEEEPTISTRKLSQRIGVSPTTAWKIINEDLNT